MIKNTYADCKIIKTRVTGSTAYVTLLIYSSKAADSQRKFRFYITDTTTNLISDLNEINPTLLSNNTYWIDHASNYENLSTNVDINLYKEVVLEIDITKQNLGEIRDNHWVRECQIILMDVTENAPTIAWISNVLNLISVEITLPQIKNLSFITDMDWNLYVDFDYEYESQADFNYQNKNIYTEISTISNSNRRVQERIRISEVNIKDKHVRVKFDNPYNDYIRVNITIKNNKDIAMMSIEKLYKPHRRLENTYIKLNGEIKKVNYIYFKCGDTIRNTEGIEKPKEEEKEGD